MRGAFHKQSVLFLCSIYLCFSSTTPKPSPSVTELPSTPKIKQQSSITNPHSETGHFHIKSMPKCGKIGAASTAGWGAGAAIFSPVGRVVLLQKGGSPPQTPHLNLERQFTPMRWVHCTLELLLSSGTVCQEDRGSGFSPECFLQVR